MKRAQAREELIESICRKEMSVYGQIFSTSGETAAVERTERRYAWLRRRLRAREDILGIFPEPWRVAQRICLAFAAQTRAQLAEILAARVRARASQQGFCLHGGLVYWHGVRVHGS